jgi:hypothetical protein
MGTMTRKEFLRTLGVTAGALAARRSPRAHAQQEDARQRVSLFLQEFDRQGNHRTGSRPDTLSAQVLSTEMQGWGVSASLEPVPMERVDPVAAFVQFRDRRVEGLPLYDAPFTDAMGVVGRIGPPDAATEIALLPTDSPAWPAIRRETTHAAVVLVTKGPRPGLVLQDAPAFGAPFGPPVLQVSSEEGEWLAEQAKNRPDVKVVAEVRRPPGQAFNVLSRVRGRDPQLPPLVVSAPRSAWFRGTSERGTALAVLLEVLRVVSAARPVRGCVFVSATGQELGDLGLRALLKQHEEIGAGVYGWLCLGPSLGASQGRLAHAASDDLEATTRSVLEAAGVAAERMSAPPGGEPALLAGVNAKLVALFGVDNPFVRTAADRWLDAVSAEALTKQAAAAAQVALALLK